MKCLDTTNKNKMKRFTTFTIVLISGIFAGPVHSQNPHEISGHLGVGANGLYRFESLEGGEGSEGGLSVSGGIRYGYTVGDQLKLISGLDYSNHRLTLISAPMPEQVRRDERIETLSVPLHVQWHLGDWFFLHGGPDIDIQVNGETGIDDQSGVGFKLGVGAQHTFGPWILSVAPAIKNYALIAFNRERYHQRLFTGGASVGFAYRF